ncbi:hypothetical protein BST61_g9692 [Cercospora zeina]
MKLLTMNFLTCARKSCKSSPTAFPLHPKEAELEQVELDMNPLFIKNMLPRLDWEAMKTLTQELGLPHLPAETPDAEALVNENEEPSQVLKDLHLLLMETSIASGKLPYGLNGEELPFNVISRSMAYNDYLMGRLGHGSLLTEALRRASNQHQEPVPANYALLDSSLAISSHQDVAQDSLGNGWQHLYEYAKSQRCELRIKTRYSTRTSMELGNYCACLWAPQIKGRLG